MIINAINIFIKSKIMVQEHIVKSTNISSLKESILFKPWSRFFYVCEISLPNKM